jgi:DNA-directed RNA polymerase subunit RPC12/RpoP
MTQYKYKLDKSSQKYNCPKCNKKRFVKYVETETGHYAESQYGRCDRETSCGYALYPTNNSIINNDYVMPTVVKPSYIEKEILQKTLTKYEINPLAVYLYSNYSEDEVKNTFEKYQVGTSNQFNKSTVFWQIDHKGKIRSGKIMAYNTSTGKRLKADDSKPLINWVHSTMNATNYNLKQCLFGLHLLNDTVKHIAIVESEKTALIMSIEFPQHTWMSTGSLQGFKHEYLTPLKSSNIIAFPDKGGYRKWQETATVLNKEGFKIEVSKLLEKTEYKDGWDLVDVIQYENIK